MKRNKKLHLKMVEGAKGLVPNIEMLDASPPQRRFVGVKIQKVEIDGVERHQFVSKEEGDIVKYHPDYVKAVKQGVLEPVDKETALLCKVPFKKKITKLEK